ncbi:SDR family oxidoreductase [Candidatus Gottesmanbacteria bacterium]|nr:SDR family oxidoreductase [Candidatus Gottesmanbacteria bacterium]
MNTSIKCLVTGGAGFIGSHLCDALIDKGYEVFCVDNLITGSKKNIAHLLNNSQFHFILHDITKPFPSTINYLYHLASPASPPVYRKYSIETLLVNSLGTYNMLELAKKENSVFLLASTSEVYGNPLTHPQKENYYGNVNPTGTRACYDEGKRFAEAITMEYVRKFKLQGRIARIFNTYGPRMQPTDGRVVSNFVTQAIAGKPLTMYGDGSQTRSFCYISDMVSGLIAACEKKGIDGEVINLGNPQELTIKRIGEIILSLTGSSSPLVRVKKKEIDDPQMRKPDISKAKQLLGWQPSVSLDLGLKETIKYFKNL